MKDYDCILGLDWLEEHYALVDCRRKKIVFRIPGEDEFSHPLPKNLARKELGPESLKVSGLGLQLCGLQKWCWLVSTVVDLIEVERQLDLSSVVARLRARSWLGARTLVDVLGPS
ncbi:hypothetical protein Taro_006334 [Colocasia esculenta]|uniref:Uncharacterized protein n=1 Tax=Colocasia esculenta TaxID=4460 RepID=A0A843TX28_COLES|nr:hypothetical protein [Colocasia esculenta]